MGLKIWLCCIFNNDAEIMPYFMQHYAPLVDHICMFNNGSTDNSQEIISGYANAEIKTYRDGNGVLDTTLLTDFASENYSAARGRADWIIWPDCDEFIWCGQRVLREVLGDYRSQGIRAIRARGYQMVSDCFPSGDAPITDQVQLGFPDEEYSKMYIFDPALTVRWRPGRHVCNIADGSAFQSDIKLLHYRYLGEDYFARRNAGNFAGQSQRDLVKRYGYQFNPDYTSGKYSAVWFKDNARRAVNVIEG